MVCITDSVRVRTPYNHHYHPITTLITTTNSGVPKTQNSAAQAPYRTYGEPSQQTMLTAQTATKTAKTAMHTPHDGTQLPRRSMRVGDAPRTVSRSHYVPK
jgi:hypothetical protein